VTFAWSGDLDRELQGGGDSFRFEEHTCPLSAEGKNMLILLVTMHFCKSPASQVANGSVSIGAFRVPSERAATLRHAGSDDHP
jgi:hypothetical protein